MTILRWQSNPDNKRLPPDVAIIRRQLQELGAWSQADDDFLALIPQPTWDPPQPSEASCFRLPDVVQDAVAGIDIGARYPTFLKELMTNTILRGLFLLELEQCRHKRRLI